MQPASEITLQFQNRLKRFSVYPAITVCLISLLVIIGWQFDIELFKRIIPGLVAMNPVTAICFILSGIIIINIYKNTSSLKQIYMFRFFALLVTFTGLLCLVTNLAGIENGVDYWLFSDKLDHEVSSIHNRMAPNTAFNFILSGIALFLLTFKTNGKPGLSQYLILVPLLISLLSIIGYIYGVKSFYGVLTYIPMAIHTSFCFLLIGTSILHVSCDKGFMADFTGNYVGSVIARKLIPAIILVPVLLGFLIIYGEINGLYVTHFGTALFTAANILIFVYLVKKIQSSANKADAARTEAENKLVKLNAELKQKTKSLQALNSELEAFSYSVSHDLKAPLRSINGYSQILLEDYADKLGEEGKHTAGVIISNTRKMGQLIDNLLEFSRIGRKELQTMPCNMNLMVKNAFGDQDELLKEKEYNLNIGNLLPCVADPQLVQHVWTNLISNALKYSQKEEKPLITIGSYKENNNNVYFVKDNGVGFDMSYSDKLFGVFQRLHHEKDFEGTGIGLAIVYKIITKHGGKVWAEAKVNEGASFYFSLPAKGQS